MGILQTGTSFSSDIPAIEIAAGKQLFVFGGAYGNLQATRALLAKAHELGFKSGEIVFTGDCVAYCANPQETAELIRDAGIHAILGNCEQALAEGANDCGCGFEEGSACDALSQQWFAFCQANLSADIIGWMARLPQHLTINMSSRQLLCTHATPGSMNRFIFPSTLGTLTDELEPSDMFDGYLVGHSGLPFIGEINGKPWVNSGAAGMPANDGTNRVWYAIVSDTGSGLCFETRPLIYDANGAANAMLEAGLVNGYRDCLTSGIWPSHDVLPAAELAKTGVPVAGMKMHFPTTETSQDAELIA